MQARTRKVLRNAGVAFCLAVSSMVVAMPAKAAEASATRYGPTTEAETVWSVSRRLQKKHAPASSNQLAWAIYRANRVAFLDGSFSLLAGAQLTIPATDFVLAVPDAEARTALMTSIRAYPEVSSAPQSVPAPTPSGPSPTQPLRSALLTQTAQAGSSGFHQHTPPVLEIRPLPGRAEPEPVRPPPPPTSAITAEETAPAAAPAPEVAPAAATAAPRFRDSESGRAALASGGNKAALYPALAAQELTYGGDVDYDYALGVAALDAGANSEAVAALSRAIAADPAYAGARLELARAYFLIGDNEAARREFEILRGQSPPPAVAQAIDSYLAAIQRKSLEYRSAALFALEVASGYDSNANAATTDSSFLGFQLNDRSVETDSAYASLSAAAQGSLPLTPGWRLTGDVDALYKAYPDASFVDTTAYGVGGGFDVRLGSVTASLGVGGQWVALDGEENHQLLSVDTGFLHAAGERWQWGLNLRHAQNRYHQAVLEIQDVDQTVGGASLLARLGASGRTQLSFAATAGVEDAEQPGSPFGRDLLGLRAGLSFQLTPRFALSTGLAGLQSDYDGLFFGQNREDQQASAQFGWAWRAAWLGGGALRGHVLYVNNDSDVSLYDYERWDAGLSLRKEFP